MKISAISLPTYNKKKNTQSVAFCGTQKASISSKQFQESKKHAQIMCRMLAFASLILATILLSYNGKKIKK